MIAPFDPASAGWSLLASDSYTNLIGPLWHRRDVDGNAPRFAMLSDRQHVNFHGIVHGGMLMSFADTALGITVWEMVGQQPCVTIQFGMQFLEAVQVGDFIEIDVEVLRRSLTVVFVRGTLRCGTKPVGSVEGVWKMLRAKT